MYRQSTAFS